MCVPAHTGTVRSERTLALQRIAALKMQDLDRPTLSRLENIARTLRHKDDDPTGLSELEFVLAMLLDAGCVSRRESYRGGRVI